MDSIFVIWRGDWAVAWQQFGWYFHVAYAVLGDDGIVRGAERFGDLDSICAWLRGIDRVEVKDVRA